MLSSTKRQVFTTRCRKAGRNGCAMVKAADLVESYLCVGSDRVSPRHLASLKGMGGRNAYRADRGYRACRDRVLLPRLDRPACEVRYTSGADHRDAEVRDLSQNLAN